MIWRNDWTWCNGCGIELTWAPVKKQAQDFCCKECARGAPCACDESVAWDRESAKVRGEQPRTWWEHAARLISRVR